MDQIMRYTRQLIILIAAVQLGIVALFMFVLVRGG